MLSKFIFTSSIFLLGPALAGVIHAPITPRQDLANYKTSCVNNVAIGFDDGPYTYEADLVNELASYGASATFFVNGYNYGCIYDEANVANIRHAYESGFSIGSHTWNHYQITDFDVATLGRQIDLVETALMKILGVKPALFRPPYGAINQESIDYLNSRGYTVVGWSTDTGDSMSPEAPVADQVAILSAAQNGNLFLAHETHETTVQQTIPQAVPGLVQRGIKLVTIDQCLNIPAYQSTGAGYGTRDETWTCDGTPAPGGGTA